jgi:hypothetical protein
MTGEFTLNFAQVQLSSFILQNFGPIQMINLLTIGTAEPLNNDHLLRFALISMMPKQANCLAKLCPFYDARPTHLIQAQR